MRHHGRASRVANVTNAFGNALAYAMPFFVVACGGSEEAPVALPLTVDATDAPSVEASDAAPDANDTARDTHDTFDGAMVDSDVGSCVDDPPGDAAPVTCLVSSAPPPAGDASAGDADAGTAYPAFALDAPRLKNAGGRVLDRAEIVTVTWSGDPEAARLEAFGDAIGGSAYWNAVTCEYGIGPARSGRCRHVRVADPPSGTMTDDTVEAFVAAHARDWVASGWPRPTSQSVYVLYLPDTVDLLLPGSRSYESACDTGIRGYHAAATLEDGTRVAYAVLPRCGFGIIDTTAAASHELVEAVTDAVPRLDPDPGDPAWRFFDDDHFAWTAFQVFQAETADACEFYRESFYSSPELGADVQRSWSNASVAAGHAPCVPTTGAPYFNVAPLDLSIVSYDLPDVIGGGTIATRGVNVPIGGTGSFTVGYYSDAPMPDDWDVRVVEGNGIPGTWSTGASAYAHGNLEVTLDKPRGHDGDRATVTVRVKGVDAFLGANLVTLVSTSTSQPGIKHFWPVLITSH